MIYRTIAMMAIGVGLAGGMGVCQMGCVENGPGAADERPVPPALVDEPIGVQMARVEKWLAGMPFRVLLDFERPVDKAFLVSPTGLTIGQGGAHTGKSSLMIGPGRREVAVKLSSVVSGEFPGSWTMAGAFFQASGPATVTVSWRSGVGTERANSRSVTLRPREWTPVFLDLTAGGPAEPGSSAGRSADAGQLVFTISGAAAVMCDDVVLVNNDRVLESPGDGSANPAVAGWTIRRRGFQTTVDQPGRFRLMLKTPEGAVDGWTCVEACGLRARFVSAAGKTWTIYSNGRQVQDGVMDTVFKSVDPAYRKVLAEQHAEPGELEVAEEFGRVDRDTEGDKNNDGYNELRGAYQLSAKGARFEVKLTPARGKVISKPVLEISGLAKGTAVVTVDGQLVERHEWIGEGRLLVEIPVEVGRGVVVNVSVK